MLKIAVVAFLVLLASPADVQQSNAALEEELRRPSLQGLPGLFLIVNTPGLLTSTDRTAIRTEAELVLRSAGVRLYTVEEKMRDPDVATLLLTVSATTPANTGDLVAWASNFEFEQGVFLERDKRIYSRGATWKLLGRFGYGPRDSILSTVREEVTRGVKAFANAYLAVNPKRQSPRRPYRPTSFLKELFQ